MNQNDDVPVPDPDPGAEGNDGPDNPERRRVLTGIAAVGLGLALAGQHLDQLALAVAGDAGDADDLAGMDLEIDLLQRRQAVVVVGIERRKFEHDVAGRPLGADGAVPVSTRHGRSARIR